MLSLDAETTFPPAKVLDSLNFPELQLTRRVSSGKRIISFFIMILRVLKNKKSYKHNDPDNFQEIPEISNAGSFRQNILGLGF
jgi:hypothetical protein